MTYIGGFPEPDRRGFRQVLCCDEAVKGSAGTRPLHRQLQGLGLLYRYRRDVLGMNEAEARAEMEQVWHPEGVWAAFIVRSC